MYGYNVGTGGGYPRSLRTGCASRCPPVGGRRVRSRNPEGCTGPPRAGRRRRRSACDARALGAQRLSVVVAGERYSHARRTRASFLSFETTRRACTGRRSACTQPCLAWREPPDESEELMNRNAPNPPAWAESVLMALLPADRAECESGDLL